jgi:hypothetical protein
MLPTNEWWVVTYLVSLAIDLINITFALLQSRLLLFTQQDAHIQALIRSLIAMFNIEIEQLAIDAIAATVNYVIFESMGIDVNQIVVHIEN